MIIIQIIIIVIIFIHIVGWAIINGLWYLFGQYKPTIGEMVLSFFLWEIGMVIIFLETINEKAKNVLSDFRCRTTKRS